MKSVKLLNVEISLHISTHMHCTQKKNRGHRNYTEMLSAKHKNLMCIYQNRLCRYSFGNFGAFSQPVSCLTVAYRSLMPALGLMWLGRVLLRRAMSLPILCAKALASSVRPARINRFFRRSFAFVASVTVYITRISGCGCNWTLRIEQLKQLRHYRRHQCPVACRLLGRSFLPRHSVRTENVTYNYRVKKKFWRTCCRSPSDFDEINYPGYLRSVRVSVTLAVNANNVDV